MARTPDDCPDAAPPSTPEDRARLFGNPLPMERADTDDLAPARGVLNGIGYVVVIVVVALGMVWLSAHLDVLATMVAAR